MEQNNATFTKRNSMMLTEFIHANNDAPIEELTYVAKDGSRHAFLRIGLKTIYCKEETRDYLFNENISKEERLAHLQYAECQNSEDPEGRWVPCVMRLGGNVSRSFSL